MEEFIKEIKAMSTSDLLLVIEDQEDLYTPEEFALLKEELKSRPANALELEEEEAERLEQIKIQEEAQRYQEQIQRQRKERLAKQQDALRNKGYDCYYEYTTLSVVDGNGGTIPQSQVVNSLNALALEGWRLVSAYANELGHNSHTDILGKTTNETVCQHVLILERRIKL